MRHTSPPHGREPSGSPAGSLGVGAAALERVVDLVSRRGDRAAPEAWKVSRDHLPGGTRIFMPGKILGLCVGRLTGVTTPLPLSSRRPAAGTSPSPASPRRYICRTGRRRPCAPRLRLERERHLLGFGDWNDEADGPPIRCRTRSPANGIFERVRIAAGTLLFSGYVDRFDPAVGFRLIAPTSRQGSSAVSRPQFDCGIA